MVKKDLDQEKSIEFLQNVEVLPIEAKISIKEHEKCVEVNRIYSINSDKTNYKNLNLLTIQYSYTKFQERIIDYKIFASNSNTAIILTQTETDSVYNTLFNNIINLELKKWRPISKKNNICENISSIAAYQFSISTKKQIPTINKMLRSKAHSVKLKLNEYCNKNSVIPEYIWQKI